MLSVMTFYRFVPLTDLPSLLQSLEAAAEGAKLRGTLHIADEGINGTLAGAPDALEAFRQRLLAVAPLAGMHCRFSRAEAGNSVFDRLKVRIRPELVRFGRPAAPRLATGERVDAERWNELLDDPDVLVLDARNRYEVAVGTFPGAESPGTRSFRQLPDYIERRLDPRRHRRIAMFCTGGVRCEKASAWLLQQGFEQVYQLDGGILHYLETIPAADNRWQGACFVFDQRESVTARELGAPEPDAVNAAPAPR